MHRRHRHSYTVMQHGHEQQREGKAEAETYEGRARRTHHIFQVFLHCGADVLEKGGGDSNRDPQFHGRAVSRIGAFANQFDRASTGRTWHKDRHVQDAAEPGRFPADLQLGV